MNPLKEWTGDFSRQPAELPIEAERLLRAQGCPNTAQHSAAVAAEAGQLAERFGLSHIAATHAAWLHDISAIIPTPQRLRAAQSLGLEVLPAEAQAPGLLHQKLSVILAAQVFQVDDAAQLSAIGCHTTLKAQAAPLDLLLFVADKLAWDQASPAPFHPAMQAALQHSLAAAAWVYLKHLRASLPHLHPWAEAAYWELAEQFQA